MPDTRQPVLRHVLEPLTALQKIPRIEQKFDARRAEPMQELVYFRNASDVTTDIIFDQEVNVVFAGQLDQRGDCICELRILRRRMP